ncbi:hypothetical protein NEDG_01116 [Nematocida displodere]|uniref:U3 small nucleolar RNA-associated protein 10 n=1 Tax=Nematocida displodere TaxID=1805483 RepID=A0A177EAL7_9MICR|nr:hypothetical protein NEDG_01116 [Nematocida displodere]
MGLSQQLARIRERTGETKGGKHLKEFASLPDAIFYDQVAEAVKEFRSKHGAAYSRHGKYFACFTGTGSRSFRRDRLTEKENEAVSRRVKAFLGALAPYIEHHHTKVLVEWMLRRYRVDTHEYVHLIGAVLRDEQNYNELLLNIERISIKGKEAIMPLITSKYSFQAVGRAVSKSIVLSMALLDSLKRVSVDIDGLRHLGFFEEVLHHAFRESVDEDVLAAWVGALLEVRDALGSEVAGGVAGEVASDMVHSLNRALRSISSRTNLIDEVKARIGLGLGLGSEVEVEVGLGSELAPTLTCLLKHYRKTGDYAPMWESGFRTEFLEEVHREVVSGTSNVDLSAFLGLLTTALVETAHDSGSGAGNSPLTVLLSSKQLFELLIQSQHWKSASRVPVVQALSKIVFCSQRNLVPEIADVDIDTVKSFLPNRQLESKILENAKATKTYRKMVDMLIDVLSDEVIEREVAKEDSWEALSHFLKESRSGVVSRSIRQDVLAAHIGKYLDTVSAFQTYTPIRSQLASHENFKKIESLIREKICKGSRTLSGLLFLLSLAQDFVLLSTLPSLISSVSTLARPEINPGIKAVLTVIQNTRASVPGDSWVRLFRAPTHTDLSISTLLFTGLAQSPPAETGPWTEILLQALRPVPESLIFTPLFLKEKTCLISGVLAQQHALIGDKDVVRACLTLTDLTRGVVLPVVQAKYPYLQTTDQHQILNEALRLKENGDSVLFQSLSQRVSIDALVQLVDLNNAFAVTTVLEAVAAAQAIEEDCISLLIAGRKKRVPEKTLAAAETKALGSAAFHLRLAERLAHHHAKDLGALKSLLGKYLHRHDASALLGALVEKKIDDPQILQMVLRKKPSTASKVAALKLLLFTGGEANLRTALDILRDRRSHQIRRLVASQLPAIVKAVLRFKVEAAEAVSQVLANLIRREENIMSAYIPEITALIKTTRKKLLLPALTLIDLRHLIFSITDLKDWVILREYVARRAEKRPLEKEEQQLLEDFYLTHVSPTKLFATSFAQLFRVGGEPRSLWMALLKKTGGVSPQLLQILSHVVNADQKACAATPSLGMLYSKLEAALLSELRAPTPLFQATLNVLSKYFACDKGTLANFQEILRLTIELALGQSPAQTLTPPQALLLPRLIASLVQSKERHKPMEAEAINQTLLQALAREADKAGLFGILEKTYQKNPQFTGRVLGQSTPYFALVLEHKDKKVRSQAERLMQVIESATGDSPYTQME